MPDKTLNLTLERKWFDLIASGTKVLEYREYKKHWKQRLLDLSGCKTFDQVLFVNGYGKNRPRMRCEFIGTMIIKSKYCRPDNGEILKPNKSYFVIYLGEIIDVNYGE